MAEHRFVHMNFMVGGRGDSPGTTFSCKQKNTKNSRAPWAGSWSHAKVSWLNFFQLSICGLGVLSSLAPGSGCDERQWQEKAITFDIIHDGCLVLCGAGGHVRS